MGDILTFIANPLIIKAGLWLLGISSDSLEADKETKAALNKLATFYRSKGVTSAKSRYEAEGQIQTGDQMWNEKEKPTEVKDETSPNA